MGENAKQGGETEDASATAPGRLAENRFYRAMAARPRRWILYHVLEREGSTVDELATVLAGWNAVDRGTMASSDDRQRWAVELHHVHLPVLAEADLVRYDRETATVDPAPLDAGVTDLVRQSVVAEGA